MGQNSRLFLEERESEQTEQLSHEMKWVVTVNDRKIKKFKTFDEALEYHRKIKNAYITKL